MTMMQYPFIPLYTRTSFYRVDPRKLQLASFSVRSYFSVELRRCCGPRESWSEYWHLAQDLGDCEAPRRVFDLFEVGVCNNLCSSPIGVFDEA